MSEGSRIFGSLALAAAATFGAAGMDDAEARTMRNMETTTDHVSVLKKGLAEIGVNTFTFVQGMRLEIETERGRVQLTRDAEDNRPPAEFAESALKGVTPEQFVKEIERQNTKRVDLAGEMPTPHGNFRFAITGYARNVLSDNDITFSPGKLTKGTSVLNLSGAGTANPNTECRVTGWREFNNYVIADCREMRMQDGQQVTVPVKYKINADLSVQVLK